MSDTIDAVLADIRELPYSLRTDVFEQVQRRVSLRVMESRNISPSARAFMDMMTWPDVLLFATADDFRTAYDAVQANAAHWAQEAQGNGSYTNQSRTIYLWSRVHINGWLDSTRPH